MDPRTESLTLPLFCPRQWRVSQPGNFAVNLSTTTKSKWPMCVDGVSFPIHNVRNPVQHFSARSAPCYLIVHYGSRGR